MEHSLFQPLHGEGGGGRPRLTGLPGRPRPPFVSAMSRRSGGAASAADLPAPRPTATWPRGPSVCCCPRSGPLSVFSPSGSYPGRCLCARSPGLACLCSSVSLAALAFFICRVHSPRFRLYQWMALLMSSHLPLIQGQNSRVSRSTSSSSPCSSSGGYGSGAIAVSRLSSSWPCGCGNSAVGMGRLSSPGP